MAKPANSKNIERDESGPNFEAVVGMVRNQLRNNDAEQKSLAQDNATLFQRIEKEHGVHKGAAKTFQSIDRMSPEKRTDYLRSLLGLLGFAGYNDFNDLVDRAQKPGAKTSEKIGGGTPAKGPKAQAPDALDGVTARALRTNLKTGWLQRTKEPVDVALNPADSLTDDDWEDVREATPEELSAERERIADFDDGAGETEVRGNVHPMPVKKH